jgi:hypothetical protein
MRADLLAEPVIRGDLHALVLHGTVKPAHLHAIGGDPHVATDQQVRDAGAGTALVHGRGINLAVGADPPGSQRCDHAR